MVDSRGPLGGVCLNVGCIPSKALLHAAKVIAETKEMTHAGLAFASPTIDLDALRAWKDGVVTRLTGGLTGLAKQRKVTTLVGTGTFTSPNMVERRRPGRFHHHRLLRRRDHRRRLRAGHAAVHPARRPPGDRLHRRAGPGRHPRAAAGARRRDHRPGDGHASTPSSAPRSRVVELMDQLIPGADKDLVTPLTKRIAKRLRGDLAGHQGHQRRSGPGRPDGVLRRHARARTRPRPPRARCSTRSWSPSGAAPTAG